MNLFTFISVLEFNSFIHGVYHLDIALHRVWKYSVYNSEEIKLSTLLSCYCDCELEVLWLNLSIKLLVCESNILFRRKQTANWFICRGSNRAHLLATQNRPEIPAIDHSISWLHIFIFIYISILFTWKVHVMSLLCCARLFYILFSWKSFATCVRLTVTQWNSKSYCYNILDGNILYVDHVGDMQFRNQSKLQTIQQMQ